MSFASPSLFSAITHHPERRATYENEQLGERLALIEARAAKLAATPHALPLPADLLSSLVERHRRVTQAYWQSLGRCASWAIVGPARFPVARMEKRNRIADKRRDEIEADASRAVAALDRAAFPHGLPGAPIRGSDPQAIEKLKARLAKINTERANNKAWSAFVSKGDWDGLAAATSAAVAASAQKLHMQGLRPFILNNLTAEARRLTARIAELEERRGSDIAPVETVGGVQLVENVELDRIQLIFPGKPDQATRDLLKRFGFRFAPSQGAWQRHLNNAGRYKASMALAAIAEAS